MIQCLLTSDEISTYSTIRTDEARWEFIYKHGFQYLLIYKEPLYPFENIPAPKMENVPKWLSVTREQSGNTTILTLESQDSDHFVDVICRQGDSLLWELVPPHLAPP